MSRSLIRKNQLHPDIADLVGQYGSGFFVSDEQVVYISGNQTISGVKTFATGIFAPNLVYITGNQTIGGYKLISGSTSTTILQVGGYSFVTPNPFLGDARFQASNPWLGASSSSLLNHVIGFDSAPSQFNVSQVLTMPGSSFLNRHGAVLVTGNQTISGTKTFDIIEIRNTNYNYFIVSTTLGNNYINLANSTSGITATLPSIASGRNYIVKNLNTGTLTVTGSNSIDGNVNLKLYKNESAHLLGVKNVGFTGWVSLNTNPGIS